MIEGTDFIRCADNCGRSIVFENVDIDGPDRMQPSGFYCKTCDNFVANQCGDRENRTCGMCKAYHAAQDLVSAVREIERHVERSQYADALRAMREIVGIEVDLCRRIRILDTKHQKGCDPNCDECRTGGLVA